MGDLISMPARCTCMEVHGEDPNCALHGIATAWALENTLPSDWQSQLLEAADEIAALRERMARADLALRNVEAGITQRLREWEGSQRGDAFSTALSVVQKERAALSRPNDGGERG